MVVCVCISVQDLVYVLKILLSVLVIEVDGDGVDWWVIVCEQSVCMQVSVECYLVVGLVVDYCQCIDVVIVVQVMCWLMVCVYDECGIVFMVVGIDLVLQFVGVSVDLEEMLGNLLDNVGCWV